MYIQASEATLASLAHHGVTAPSQVTARNSLRQLVLPNTSCHRTLDLDDRTIVSIEQPGPRQRLLADIARIDWLRAIP